MPIYSLLERQRVRARGRARPNAPGFFVSSRIQAQWYTLTMRPTAEHYEASRLMDKQYSKAVGYQDNPAPRPPWVPLVPLTNPQEYTPYAADVEPPRIPPTGIPTGVTPTISLSPKGGLVGRFVPGVLPAQLNATRLNISRVTLLADATNALTIWTGYSPYIQADDSFPLVPGASRDYDIDDLSQLWILGENATDGVFFIYEV